MYKVFERYNKILEHAKFGIAFVGFAALMLFSSTILVIENRLYIRPTLIKLEEEYAKNKDYKPTTAEGECPETTYQFHDMIYYTVVSFSTAGYGDIFPHTPIG